MVIIFIVILPNPMLKVPFGVSILCPRSGSIYHHLNDNVLKSHEYEHKYEM